MRPLSASDLLRAWEQGLRQLPVDRVLTLLAIGTGDRARDELAALSVGARDTLLLALREATLGPALRAFAECARCGSPLELALACSEICVAAPSGAPAPEYEFAAGGFVVRFRLPDSRDLTAVAEVDDVSVARRLLLRSCVTSATHEGVEVPGDELLEDVAMSLAARMLELDPQAEVRLRLTCPECEHMWELMFDIAEFFWAEVAALAGRLVREVDTLARAYGWREDDILAMSAGRRELYLALVGA